MLLRSTRCRQLVSCSVRLHSVRLVIRNVGEGTRARAAAATSSSASGGRGHYGVRSGLVQVPASTSRRLVEAGLKLSPDVYQATPHAVIGRVPPEAELEVAAAARALVPSPTFRMTSLALWSLTEHDASCLHRVLLSGVL